MVALNKTNIEWVRNPPDNRVKGFTVSPVVGCNGVGCAVKKVCFAKKQSKRMKHRCQKCYDFIPHWHLERLPYILKRRIPAGIFICDMGDLFDKEIPDAIIQQILAVAEACPQHRIYILTKQAQRLEYFHYHPNVWLGVTVNNKDDEWRIEGLMKTDAKVKFVSFEPLYGLVNLLPSDKLDWIIIGAQTHPERQPNNLWVTTLIGQARAKNIPIFLKDNLRMRHQICTIQEFPKNG